MSGTRPIVLGVLAAGCAGVWAVFHSMRRMSIGALFGYAALYVAIAAAACIVAFAVSQPPRRVCVRHHFLSALAIACFMPSLALFADAESVWLIVPVAAISAVSAFAAFAHKPPSPVYSDASRGLVLSGPLPAVSIRQEALWASVMLQSGCLLASVEQALWATPFIAAGTFALAKGAFPLASRSGLPCQDAEGCVRKLGLAAASGVLLTAIALEPHLERTRLYGGEGDTDRPPLTESVVPGDPDPSKDDVHQGVIILPEVEEHVTLIPPMPSMRQSSGPARSVIPFSMPFFGAYWVYRPPHKRPPPGSLVIRGKPADRKLRSTDRVHLRMEARQNFGSYIELSCCSRVDVSIASRDSFYSTVKLEFIARDSSTGAQESLGVQSVPAVRGSFRDNAPVVRETLSFPVRRATRFDEAVLVFHLAAMRADMAARVSIERFVFVPR